MTGVLTLSLALGCKERFSVYGFSFQLSAFFLLLFWAQEEPDISPLVPGSGASTLP